MNPRTTTAVTLPLLGAAAAAASYPLLWRRWCLTWGARPDEVERAMPGDELMPNPDMLATRAVTIAAPPSAVWPWLVQMGSGRGGVYTYDWIENLFGLRMHSVDEILPEFQDISVGFAQQLGKAGPVMRVAILDPERALVFAADAANWVWAFGLYEENGGTRLVSRNRIATPDASIFARIAYTMVMEPGSLLMERKMLLGIKERAERLAGGTVPAAGAPREAEASLRGARVGAAIRG